MCYFSVFSIRNNYFIYFWLSWLRSSSPNALCVQQNTRTRNANYNQNRGYNNESDNDNDDSQRQRGESFSSSFDTPQGDFGQQHQQQQQQQRQESSENRQLNDNINLSSPPESSSEPNIFGENDDDNQLVVLVQHRGSDDELVIGLDGEITNSEGTSTNTNNDDDDGYEEDLLDIPFARNGSITTVGVVSEGNMAFNSASVAMDPSVSSLVSSSLCDDVAVVDGCDDGGNFGGDASLDDGISKQPQKSVCLN